LTAETEASIGRISLPAVDGERNVGIQGEGGPAIDADGAERDRTQKLFEQMR
jgi:hypothetical protein